MKYCLMLEDGQYQENNFALIIINARRAGYLDNLVVLNKNSSFHNSLDIEPNTTIIVDKYKSFLNRNLELLKIKDEDIASNYLRYLNNHEMDGTPKSNCCDGEILENTDLCSDCKEHSEVKYPNKKKEDWLKDSKIKSLIASVSNIFLDTFDIIESKDEAGLITFLADNGVYTFRNATVMIKEFVEKYGYRLLPRSNVYVDFNNLEKSEELSDSVGKFAIIKDEEKFIKVSTVKPITVFADRGETGYIIGNQGRNIKRLVRDFNLTNKNWVVPYINVKSIEERTTNNSMSKIKDDYYELLKVIFKEINKEHDFWHKRG